MNQLDDTFETSESGRLTLGHFAAAVRARARLVWIVLAVCVLAACTLILIVPNQYTITIVVYPAQSAGSKGLSGTLSSIAAPLAGLFGSSSTSDVQPFDIYSELIVSPRVAARIVNQDPEALQKIFYKEWDPSAKKFYPPHDPVSVVKRVFNYIFGLPTYQPPTPARLAQWLSDNLTLTPINSTSIQQISFSTPYPAFGIRFLKEMNANADAVIRDEAIQLTDAQISYLEGKLAETQSADYRTTLLGLLSQQVGTRMSINKNVAYASSTLQGSFGTDLPTWPNPILMLAVAVFLGLVLGTLAALSAALIWPFGFGYFHPSGNFFTTACRRAIWYIFEVQEKGVSATQ